MIQIALIICMGGLQVFVVRFFFQVGSRVLSRGIIANETFQGARKGYV